MLVEPKKKLIIFLSFFFITALIGLSVFFFLRQQPTALIAPLIETKWRLFPSTKTMEVIGFLPYWNLGSETQVDFSAIDTLIYFSLLVDENGEIITFQDGGTEPGWLNLDSDRLAQLMAEARSSGKKTMISFASFDATVMKAVVSDRDKQATLIGEINEIFKKKKLDGVDIDFEYFPDGDDPDFGRDFNSFLADLKNSLTKINPKATVSVDIYPKAIIEDKPYNLKTMDTIIDRVILMAYDFTQSISDTTGPVAPLKAVGIGEKGYSITQALQASFGKISSEKLVLGIPLYGYEWETTDSEPKTSAYPRSGVVASYKRVMELIAERNLQPAWDATASSPWLNYEDEGVNKQIYYEDMRSLSLKIELAKQLKIAGIAFWALGYEGNSGELWLHLKKTL